MSWEKQMFEKTTGTGAGLVEQGLTPHRGQVVVPDHHRVDLRIGGEVIASGPGTLPRAVLIETPTPGSEGRGLPNEPAAPRKKRAAPAPAKKARR